MLRTLAQAQALARWAQEQERKRQALLLPTREERRQELERWGEILRKLNQEDSSEG